MPLCCSCTLFDYSICTNKKISQISARVLCISWEFRYKVSIFLMILFRFKVNQILNSWFWSTIAQDMQKMLTICSFTNTRIYNTNIICMLDLWNWHDCLRCCFQKTERDRIYLALYNYNTQLFTDISLCSNKSSLTSIEHQENSNPYNYQSNFT